MAKCKKLVLFTIALLINVLVMAQDSAPSTAAQEGGLMRSEAKIYVVMVVVITILAGLLIYVIRLDKKISRLEKGNL
jgi:hypothetical protein